MRASLAPAGTLMALEPRLMFDGVGATAIDPGRMSPDAVDGSQSADRWASASNLASSNPGRTTDPRSANAAAELVVIDPSVPDLATLRGALRDGVDVLVLDASRDGLAQIAQAVAERDGTLQAIHLISHGGVGQITLGSRTIDMASLDAYRAELGQIGEALTAEGDLLLYGCDVGDGRDGMAFLQAIAAATSADVAASADATGAPARGGDWALEHSTGTIDVGSAVADPQAWQHVLPGAPTVTPTIDRGDVLIGEAFRFTVAFDNAGADPGFGPYVDLFVPSRGADGGGTPDGVTITGATYLGRPLTVTQIVLTGGDIALGTVAHPYARDTANNDRVAIPSGFVAGDRLVVVELPFGSFTPDQPAAAISVDAQLSSLADVGSALQIAARGGFRYGNDALANPATDPTIQSATSTLAITPSLYRLTTTYIGPENETTTGPNFVRAYRIDVDVADGQTLGAVDLSTALASGMQFTAISGTPTVIGGTSIGATPAGGWTNVAGVLVSGAASGTSAPVAPGGTVSRTLPSVAGTTASADASMVVAFHVPRLDAAAAPVIDAASGDAVTMVAGSAMAATWTPTDPRDAAGPVGATVASAHALEASSLQVQVSQSVAVDAAAAGLTPGDELRYTVDVQVSDFFAFGHRAGGPGAPAASPLQVTDTLSDGLSLLDSGMGAYADPVLTVSREGAAAENYTLTRGVHYAVTTLPDGRERVVFDLAAALPGGAGQVLVGDLFDDPTQNGATTARIVFTALVLPEYRVSAPDASGNPIPGATQRALNQGDRVVDTAVVSGTVLDASLDPSVPGLLGQSDDTLASRSIGSQNVDIVVWGRNRLTVPIDPSNPARIAPGDSVSYVMTYTVPTGDYQDLALTAFLPLPLMSATDPDADGTANPCTLMPGGYYAKPPVGQYSFEIVGGDGTGGTAPIVTADPGGNALRFDFGDRSDPTDQPVTIRVAFTVQTSTTAQFTDGLFLTAQAQSDSSSTGNEPLQSLAIVQVRTTEPQLTIRHGIVNDDIDYGTSIVDPTYSTSDPRALVHPAGNTSGNPLLATIGDPQVAILDADVSDVDGSDQLRYAIVVQNLGSSYRGAFDVTVNEALADCVDPASVTRLRVALGDGTVIYDGTPGTLGNLVRGDGATFATEADAIAALVGGQGLQMVDLIGADLLPDTADDRGRLGGTTDENGAARPVGSNVLIVTYDARLRTTVEAGDACTATATLSNYAVANGGPDRTPTDLSDTATLTVTLPAADKTIVATSEPAPTTAGNDVVIGERVTYEVVLTVPEGRTSNAVFVDTLDTGLSFVSIDSISASPGLTFSGGLPAPGSVVPTAAGGDANRITIPLGTITNANSDNAVAERVTVRYTVVVDNLAGNQQGTLQGNDVRFTSTEATVSDAAPDLTVVEPSLALVLAASAPTADAGDGVTFDLTITAAGGRPPAFDVALDVANLVPAGLVYDGGSLIQVSGPAAATLGFGGAGLAASWSQLDAGSVVVLRYSATVSGAASPGAVYDQNATVRFSSLPGTGNTNLSPFATVGDAERTGSTADPGGALNDYLATDNEPVTTAVAVPVLTLVRTSEPSSTGTTVVPGEVLRYRMVVQVPEGTAPDAEICPTLPTGVRFVNDGSATIAFVANGGGTGIDSAAITGSGPDLAGGGGSPAAITGLLPTFVVPGTAIRDGLGNPVPGGSVMASGTAPCFVLDDITNTDRDADGEFIVIEFNAILDNATTNVAGVDRTTTFDWETGGVVRATSNAVTVSIAEPAIVDVDKRVVASTQDSATFEVVFSNTGTEEAHDVRLLDEFAGATNLAFGGAGSVTGLPVGAINASDADTLDIRIPVLAPGESVTIRYLATVPDTTSASPPRDAVVTYTSLSAGGTSLAVTTASGTVTTPSTGERTGDTADYGATANTYRDNDAAGLGKIRGYVWDDTNVPDDAIGASEPRLRDVLVTLTHAGVDNVFGTGDDQVRTQLTAPDGLYGFSAVPEGNVRITVATVIPAANGGTLGEVRSRFDVQGARTDGRIDLAVVSGTLYADRNFGFVEVNDPPTVSVPAALTVAEDTRLAVPGVSVADPDAGAAPTVRVTLTVTQGRLDVVDTPVVGITGNNTATLVLTGAIADLNTVLATLGYRGTLDFNGSDTLTVRIDDRGNRGDADDDRQPNEPTDDNLSASATVPITVTPVDDPLSARPDTRTVPEDGPPIRGNAVTGNGVAGGQPGDVADFDPEGDPMTVVGVARGTSAAPVAGSVGSGVIGGWGTLTLNADGSYSYAPAPVAQSLASGQTAQDVFTYTIRDPSGNLATTTITVTLTGANDPPLAGDSSSVVDQFAPRAPVAPVPPVSDPDNPNPELTVRIDTVQRPQAGTFTRADGTPVAPGQSMTVNDLQRLQFQPNPTYNAPMSADGTMPGGSLTFTVTDPNGGSDPGTIMVAIRPSTGPGPLPPPPPPPTTVFADGSPTADSSTVIVAPGAPPSVPGAGIGPTSTPVAQAVAGVNGVAPDGPPSAAAMLAPYTFGPMTSDMRFERFDDPVRQASNEARDAMLADQQRLLDQNLTDLDAGGLFPSTRATGLFGDERIGPTRDWTPLAAAPEPQRTEASAAVAPVAPAPAARAVAPDDDCAPEPKPKPKPIKRVSDAVQRPTTSFSQQLDVQKKKFRPPAQVAPKPPPQRQC